MHTRQYATSELRHSFVARKECQLKKNISDVKNTRLAQLFEDNFDRKVFKFLFSFRILCSVMIITHEFKKSLFTFLEGRPRH